MELDKKLELLVTSLLEKTRGGRIEWAVSSGDDSYMAAFPSFSVTISRSFSFSGTSYTLDIQDFNGVEIESVHSDHLAPGQMSELFDLARRRALNVDSSVSQLLEELSQV